MRVAHVHNDHAKDGGKPRAAFWEELARLCAGGVRVIGKDANMGFSGTIP
jgi:hypothetical protein